MTKMEFFGCTFIAFGPPFALFLFTIARDPLRVIVFVASGFFWLLSLLISSILWFIMERLWIGQDRIRGSLSVGLVFSVIFQELFRFVFYKLLRKADEGLQRVSQTGQTPNIVPKDITDKNIMAYVSGLGFGVICGAFSIVNVLADMIGPGTVGIHGDSQYFILASAFLTLCFVFLHTFWGVIFFYAWDRKRYQFVGLVICSHMIISCLTVVNQQTYSQSNSLYLASLIPAYCIMLMMGAIAFNIAGGSIGNIKNAIHCSKGRHETD